MNNVIRKVLIEVLEKNYYTNVNGTYVYEIYAEWNERISNEEIIKILESNIPLYKLEEYLLDSYLDTIDEIEVPCFKEVEEILEEEYSDLKFDYEDIVDEYSMIACINIPIKHYLNQAVQANLILDAGDSNYDFSINGGYGSFQDEEVSKESGILWLANSQGYNKKQLEEALFFEYKRDSNFLSSINDEVNNVTTSMNAVSFLIDLTLEELIKFNCLGDNDSIKIDKNTNCGLVDYWCGAGSLLSVNLEKDIIIPKKNIFDFGIDGNIGYGIKDIYGVSNDLWNGKVTIVKGVDEEIA